MLNLQHFIGGINSPSSLFVAKEVMKQKPLRMGATGIFERLFGFAQIHFSTSWPAHSIRKARLIRSKIDF